MASSSSSSQPIPAWSYDVFLSFRGKDTRNGFVGHLYAALEQQGIQAYKDDETLPRGESIRPALLKAIEESRIAVVVFSENYADSSWCLAELAHIIECVDKRGQILMPIFYYVDPSDVRKLKRKYEAAFSKHVTENKEKVESWRKALEKAGSISGWTINDTINCHEAKCISDIVGTISSRLSSLITGDYKDLIGMETRLRDLKLMLEIGSGGVRMVGIWGVGGGGKTTLASAAYMEISHQFEARCLLENIREESSKHGLKKLQEKILSVALKTTVVVDSEIEGRSMIKGRLCHKRVLVVLDDVDDLEQLEALAGSHDWFGEGSRIIITTRDENMLSARAHTIYGVTLLSDGEAIKLFNRHAYNKDKPVEDYETLSLDVVSYAGGLPLALKVIGSFLYDKDKDEWKSTLAKLKCIPEKKVMERLKISYDGLEPYQKDLFLDIACFMRHNYSLEMDDAMMVLDACNFHPVIGLKVLEQKSLIKVSKEGRFEMHDLIEEMAHYIVRGEHPNNLEKHSRIWKKEDLKYLCDMGAAAPSMENEVLANLPEYIISHPGLFDVVANMKNLRWILWNWHPASSFPSNFQPTKLCCLKLRFSKQKKLWEGCKSLPNLKVLDLGHSENLITTPDIEGLPCLERLILEGCKSLEEIHPSIGYHKRLVFVNMRWCTALKRFPTIIDMKKLETLNLSTCSQLQQFPDIQSNMSLPNLKFLDLGKSRNLITTPDFEGLPCLERLSLMGCGSLEEIHPSIGYHKRLVFVDMIWCTGLERFPPIIQMEKLETLYLSSCYKLQQFPDIQSNMSLPNLKILDLDRSRNLIKTPDFEGLPCLERLILSHCRSLEEIHPSIGYHKRLVFVNMKWCVRLKRFPPIIHMKNLETLILFGCRQLQQFPDIRSNMDSLVTFDLSCSGIEIIPLSVGPFCTNLVSLYLGRCRKLKRIEGNFHLLRSLKYLDLRCCVGLSFHHDGSVGLRQFPRFLRKLDLSWCKLGDGDVPSDIFCELANLQVLDLSGNNFSRLPSGISRLPCLKLLNLSDCINLVELSDLPSSIAILKAQGCDSLEIVRDLSDYKWLWKVSLPERTLNKRVLLSMLQEHAVKEDRFMSVLSPNVQPSRIYTKLVTLQLPHNWYSDFSGFLLSLRAHDCDVRMYRIVIKREMSTDHPKEFGEDCKKYDYEMVGYVPFSSLRHIPWFNPTYTQNISFQTENNDPDYDDVDVGLSVELVPSKSKIGDLNEHPIDYSECWDEEYEDNKTFEITYDSSEIQISWG